MKGLLIFIVQSFIVDVDDEGTEEVGLGFGDFHDGLGDHLLEVFIEGL